MAQQAHFRPISPVADQRTQQILSGVRRAFAEKGFDGASMQDLARAAGMSVGNFYNYFPSKAAIVEALVIQDLASMEQDFAAISGSADPIHALRETIFKRISSESCAEDAPLWAEMAAASLRKPEIGAVTSRMEAEIQNYLVSIFARTTGLRAETAGERFGPQAKMVVMIVRACNIQPPGLSSEREGVVALAMRIIDSILDDVRGSVARSRGL